MEINNNIEINNNEQKHIIINNILIMLSERNILDKNKLTEIYDSIKNNINNSSIIDISHNDKNILINFIDIKISSIKKIENLDNIIDNNKINIFIVNYIQTKIWEKLISYNIEIFYKHELMINLIDHELIPEHKLLNNEEKTTFMSKYTNDLENLPKIKIYDPISRYYNAKINDIFRITRPSITSGYSIFYRVVINSSLPEI